MEDPSTNIGQRYCSTRWKFYLVDVTSICTGWKFYLFWTDVTSIGKDHVSPSGWVVNPLYSPTAYFDVETYDFITQDTVSLRLVVGLTTTSTFEQTGVFHALNSLVDGQLWQYWERTRNKVTSTTDPALSWESIQGFLYFS
jgi:hypothetical protein